jgi:hypothetical protein
MMAAGVGQVMVGVVLEPHVVHGAIDPLPQPVVVRVAMVRSVKATARQSSLATEANANALRMTSSLLNCKAEITNNRQSAYCLFLYTIIAAIQRNVKFA